jgi:hypothetical protein
MNIGLEKHPPFLINWLDIKEIVSEIILDGIKVVPSKENRRLLFNAFTDHAYFTRVPKLKHCV